MDRKKTILYTYLFEYGKELCIFQVESSNRSLSKSIWITTVSSSLLNKVKPKIIDKFIEDINSEKFTKISETVNVWCICGRLQEELTLTNIVKTKRILLPAEQNLFTYILFYNGGTYIRQVKGSTLLNSFVQWSNYIYTENSFENIFYNNSSLKKKLDRQKIFNVEKYRNLWNIKFTYNNKDVIIYIVLTMDS